MLVWQIDDVFLLEPLLVEETADFSYLYNLVERTCLRLYVAAFQTENAVGQGIVLLLGDVLPDNLIQIGQGHDCTADNEVVLTLFVFAAQVGRLAVLQTDGLTNFLCHPDFLARAVDQLELAAWKQNGQGDSREAATRAEIKDTGARLETDDLGYRHRVEHVMLVEMVDVFSGDDIDLVVPVAIEGIERLYLTALLRRQVLEVFTDQLVHA